MIQPTLSKISNIVQALVHEQLLSFEQAISYEKFIQSFMQTMWMRRYAVLPLYQQANVLFVATDRILSSEIARMIQFHTGLTLEWVIVASEKLTLWREQLLPQTVQDRSPQEYLSSKENFSARDFVQNLIQQAIQKKASDMHFEPYETYYRVRLRLDGLLYEIATAPLNMANRITAYLKVMAHLDTSERRLPQDGRFQIALDASTNQHIDCRMSTCPTINGEKIVVRLLNDRDWQKSIDDLGFMDSQKKCFIDTLSLPQGLILVTGPTGSGKTMTLYTALNYLNREERNISTIEDPVEMRISGINQVGINNKASLTFAKVIRTFLRQDPDVLMVGEIRDLETAQMAIHAAQTGHLVLSTLHANSAIDTMSRMKHLGIPGHQLASSVKLIIAQRLVRRLCERCYSKNIENCIYCQQGYKGRLGVFEMLPVTSQLSELITSGVHRVVLEQFMREQALITLYESGMKKVAANLTNLEEIHRVIGKSSYY